MQTIHYTHCPVCGSSSIKAVFAAKDHTVSQQEFTILECENCCLRFTQDIPVETESGAYYKAEDYISHTNTSKGFINRLYQSVRKRTLVQKRKLIERITGLRKGKLLDVGAGTGAFADQMKSHGWELTALEPDQGAREVSARLYKIEIRPADELFKLPVGSFNAITLWHVLEHVHDLHGYIKQFKQLLKPDGKLFIAVPNYTSIDAGIYGKDWAAYDVPRHLYHFCPKAMKELIESHGMKIIKYLPMWYDSFYISMLSSKYKTGKTNLFGSVLNGFRSNLKAIGNKQRCSSVIYVIGK
jgi:SAM-dependent methyltransferase